jgi:hypothetical protein
MEGKERKGLAREQSSRELSGCGELVRRRKEGEGRRLRPIYPKLMAVKKAVKSKFDVALRMTLRIPDERIQQRASAGELPR